MMQDFIQLERIDILTDKSSFNEVGKLAGHAIYNENNDLIDFKGSNFILGKQKLMEETLLLVEMILH